MKDFTLRFYSVLIDALVVSGYKFQTFREFMLEPLDRVVILRHDVDNKPGNSLRFAQIEHEKGLKASYFFRVVPESLHVDRLMAIKALGHEIGYHYEDMDPAKGDPEKAIKSFGENLRKLRKLAPIDTICMHVRFPSMTIKSFGGILITESTASSVNHTSMWITPSCSTSPIPAGSGTTAMPASGTR